MKSTYIILLQLKHLTNSFACVATWTHLLQTILTYNLEGHSLLLMGKIII